MAEKEQAEHVISEERDELKGEEEESEEPKGRSLAVFSLAALGVVYGDIGTSPLYALRKCFHETHTLAVNEANVLGVLSLILWSLILVVSVKYLVYVMKASNDGEGGILALMALAVPGGEPRRRTEWLLLAVGMFGGAGLYADGMLTPAISVMSAVEGLGVVTKSMDPYIVPITVGILFGLFMFQRRGTLGVGSVFGPVMLLWFVTLAVLGVHGILREPSVLRAANPWHAIQFFSMNGWAGYVILGSVFLVVTGSEALYADMGHLGRNPIRLAWFSLVLPALVLNYFGQGALLLQQNGVGNPFYELAPGWTRYPLVGLAIAATVIASQAIISGAFSLTRQAVLLGELPRMSIVQTSREKVGQIYIPTVNWILMIAAIGLVLTFRKSTSLAGAYGMTVSQAMVITTVLVYFVARDKWRWSLWAAGGVTAALLVMDLAFLGTNLLKFLQGGWIPLAVSLVVWGVMHCWRHGQSTVGRWVEEATVPVEAVQKRIKEDQLPRVPGTAVFLTAQPQGVPMILVRHIEHNQVLHERVVLTTVEMEKVPRVSWKERVEVKELGDGLWRMILHYGFMEDPNIPAVLRREKEKLDLDLEKVTYYVGHLMLVRSEADRRRSWRTRVYAVLARNAAESTAFYGLPADRVFDTGVRVEL